MYTIYIFPTEKNILKALETRLDTYEIELNCNYSRSIDIFVATKSTEVKYNTEICIVNGEKLPKILGYENIKHLVSCGMNEKDTANFSSITEGRAMLCLQRKIIFYQYTIEAGEYAVIYDENLSLWENLVCSLCEIIIQMSNIKDEGRQI